MLIRGDEWISDVLCLVLLLLAPQIDNLVDCCLSTCSLLENINSVSSKSDPCFFYWITLEDCSYWSFTGTSVQWFHTQRLNYYKLVTGMFEITDRLEIEQTPATHPFLVSWKRQTERLRSLNYSRRKSAWDLALCLTLLSLLNFASQHRQFCCVSSPHLKGIFGIVSSYCSYR